MCHGKYQKIQRNPNISFSAKGLAACLVFISNPMDLLDEKFKTPEFVEAVKELSDKGFIILEEGESDPLLVKTINYKK